MSNTLQEFEALLSAAATDPSIHPALVFVNGAQGQMSSEAWRDADHLAWQVLATRLLAEGVTAAQVQVAWIKLAQQGDGPFPAKAEALQADLEATVRNLKEKLGEAAKLLDDGVGG